MKDSYSKRAHSVGCLSYHAVFVIKYRRPVIDDEIMEFMKQHVKYLVEECYQGKLLEMNGEPDHVHILFELPPSAAPSVIVCSLKTQLSKEVRARFHDRIQDKLWKDTFWSRSYFLATTGGVNLETLEKYIEEQGIEKPTRKYTRRKRV